MIDGFVTSYRDDIGYVHLYFFPGIDENGEQIYKDIGMSSSNGYDIVKYDDGAIEYILHSKNTIQIDCKLVPKDTTKETKFVTLKHKHKKETNKDI